MSRRARLREVGWAANLEVEPFEPPAPTGDQVVIAVEACGVCHRDCIDRAGRFAFVRVPITPGHEAVGRVIAIGPQVRDWRVGDRVASMHRDACPPAQACDACAAGETSLCERSAAVLGLLIDGGYASHLVAPERCFYRMPDEVPAPLAAIFHCTLGTAFRGLVRAGGLEAGMRALVTGGNGGVGAAAVQVAARLGARVIAVVRRAEHGPLVEELGASAVIVDDEGRFHKRLPGGLVDVAIDCVGAPTFNAALRSLRLGGRLIAVGNVADARVDVNLGFLITRGLRVVGSSGATRRDMDELLGLHAARPLTMPVHAALPLADADRAQRQVAAGGLAGRIVLVP
jgi:acryloyl-coenzyme A reductase